MHFTAQTDYSLRLLMLLGMVAPKRLTIGQVANILRLKKNHLTKIVHHLAKQNILHTSRGKSGGIGLHPDAPHKTIAEIVKLSEPSFALVECQNNKNCACEFVGYCELTTLFTDAMSKFFNELSKKTLQDVLNTKKEKPPLLMNRINSEPI